MTRVNHTDAELTLVDRQRKPGVPYPDDIFVWRKAQAATIAAVEAEQPGGSGDLARPSDPESPERTRLSGDSAVSARRLAAVLARGSSGDSATTILRLVLAGED